jgi:hypothetical protein
MASSYLSSSALRASSVIGEIAASCPPAVFPDAQHNMDMNDPFKLSNVSFPIICFFCETSTCHAMKFCKEHLRPHCGCSLNAATGREEAQRESKYGHVFSDSTEGSIGEVQQRPDMSITRWMHSPHRIMKRLSDTANKGIVLFRSKWARPKFLVPTANTY